MADTAPDTAMGAALSLSRRAFLLSVSATAGGMALGIMPPAASGADGAGAEFSAWVVIGRDDTVIIRVPTPEIGNGAMTQVAMNVTEELACAWSRVRVEFGAIHRDYLEKGVYSAGFLPFFAGHGTDRQRMKRALQLGASARERLKVAAATRWKAAAADIDAQDGVLTHKPTGRRLRYGQVAAEAARVELAVEPTLKPESDWTFLGKASPAKLNTPDIVTGRLVFGIDVRQPGMVHAALRQPPVHGGKVKSVDADAVRGMPGVRAVVIIDPANTKGAPIRPKATFTLGDTTAQWGVAVIADHYWQAKMALDALPVDWDANPAAAAFATVEHIRAAVDARLDKAEGRVLRKAGDVAATSGARVVDGVYATPYCENAAMEPLNATALVTADGAEVWCPTQDQQQAYWVVIDETGLPPESVKLHQTFVGGGFGRRTQADDVRMAVAVAKAYPGVPVKTIWSREECFRQGRYRTPITSRFRAVLDDGTGLPAAVEAEACFTGSRPTFHLTMGFDDVPYFTSGIVPNVLIRSSAQPVHVLNGAWRGPCYNSHAFIVETFIDECAHAAGADPLDYRLRLVNTWDQSWSDCLRTAARHAGWGRQLPRGEGLGIAISGWPQAAVHAMGTIVCTVAHVAVSPAGEIRVKKIDVAFDCGRVANRDAVAAQLEGGTLFGLNAALQEELTLVDGAVVEANFDQYPMLRLADTPPIDIHFDALSGHSRMDIVGEAPVGPVSAAVGNAIFSAIGKRVRGTPFSRHDLRWI
ncbi:xanthine dehydrogenase family protein molybdopterin-binding subunit [Nitrospirillum iridis]|uniref:Isoquinoline 1-oxidoreductase beta subunit n=1 Tax=Nitrospirillum iridis TaxID=765888 RepID=A0A7X0B1L1_9PROT|nr:molybdopterin cofactor-binding domain-containing protein [Nitrospirillum iridis]MBB6253301.1 isoquinoline 1-oxidoreductase beta subunit [Nitrospirillum iridis]